MQEIGKMMDDFDFEKRFGMFVADDEREAEIEAERQREEAEKAEQEKKNEIVRKVIKLKSFGFGKREIDVAMNNPHPYENKVLESIDTKTFILLMGDCGTGKTVLSCRIAHLSNKPTIYRRFYELLLDIRDTYKPNSPRTEKEVMDDMKNIPLLIIDELQDRQTDKENPDIILNTIIDYRYSNMMPTIFITNGNMSTFRDVTTRSIVSRCVHAGRAIELKNETFRK